MFKNITIYLLFFSLLSCSSNENLENCIQSLPLNITSDLNNPSLINVQIPGGYAFLNGGNKGILLFNKNGTDFVAFDRLCPTRDCNEPMTFENRLLTCSCDNGTYSVDFGGAPQKEGFQCPAIEYRVIVNGSTIRITNF